jgi:hypothetical protein
MNSQPCLNFLRFSLAVVLRDHALDTGVESVAVIHGRKGQAELVVAGVSKTTKDSGKRHY